MAVVIELNDLRNGYIDLVSKVQTEGREVSPRGMLTREIRDAIIVLKNPYDAVPLGINRKLNLKIGAAEATHLVAGIADAHQLDRASKGNFKQFMVGDRLLGEYGPRLVRQLEDVVVQLCNDSDTRQAAALVWKPDELELAQSGNPDVPCTVMCAWNVRDGKLNASTVMRSNDVWWGVAYDFWMYTRLQITLAWALGLKVGDYTHHAVSLHIYERDFDKLSTLSTTNDPVDSLTNLPPGFVRLHDTRPGERDAEVALKRWKQARTWATAACFGKWGMPLPESVRWYAQRLEDTKSEDGLLCSKCRYVLPRTSNNFFTWQIEESTQVGRCKDCLRADELRRKENDPHKDLRRRCQTYGITVDYYYALLDEQEYLCAGCHETPDNGRWKDFVIDHDHETGRVRGLLCNNCNHALGLIKDDSQTASRLSDYLQ